MKQILIAIRNFIKDRFSLHEDRAQDSEVIESIKRNIEFKGTNLWSLIFAIFIASIGLNVNSTAVIIGAMLISPLMGPIMGVGMGMGINDIEIIRKGLKNLLIAVIISIGVSAFYFFISPLHEAQSELLARTTPSTWDVLIAIFGGLAGIVGSTRREKGTVIPGVAIATALMPPLCTAGFGIAIGNWYYFLGALYLFFINSVFICISSYFIVRYMKLPQKAFEDKNRKKTVIKYILSLVLITGLPSIYLTYKIVDKSIFESNANKFVRAEFNFDKTHVINKVFKYENGKKEISLLLIGEDLPKKTIDSLKAKLSKYGISDSQLQIRQGLNAKQKIDFSQIKASILEDVFKKQAAEKSKDTMQATVAVNTEYPDLKNEIRALYPNITSYGISDLLINSIDSSHIDTGILFVANFSTSIRKSEQRKLVTWLRVRLGNPKKVIRFVAYSQQRVDGL